MVCPIPQGDHEKKETTRQNIMSASATYRAAITSGQSNLTKAASTPHIDGSHRPVVFARLHHVTPMIMLPWNYPNPHPKRHQDRLSRFYTAARHSVYMGRPFSPQNFRFPLVDLDPAGGSGPHHGSLGPPDSIYKLHPIKLPWKVRAKTVSCKGKRYLNKTKSICVQRQQTWLTQRDRTTF